MSYVDEWRVYSQRMEYVGCLKFDGFDDIPAMLVIITERTKERIITVNHTIEISASAHAIHRQGEFNEHMMKLIKKQKRVDLVFDEQKGSSYKGKAYLIDFNLDIMALRIEAVFRIISGELELIE